jgi:hypothetical protein
MVQHLQDFYDLKALSKKLGEVGASFRITILPEEPELDGMKVEELEVMGEYLALQRQRATQGVSTCTEDNYGITSRLWD